MRYERRIRRLVPFCVVLIALAGIGFRLSFVPYFFALPSVVMSAFSLSLQAFSSSILAAVCAALYFVRDLFQEEGGLRRVLTDWKAWIDSLKRVARALVVFAILWIPTYLWNFYKSYQVFVKHPPSMVITWTPANPGEIELIPGTGPDSPTPDTLGKRRQYVLEVYPVKGTTISSDTEIVLRFPFVVENGQSQMRVWDGRTTLATFTPHVSPIPVKLIGPHGKFFGRQQYKYWHLYINNLSPQGRVRLLLMLNPDYKDMVIRVYTGPNPPKQEEAPTFLPDKPLGPLNEYVWSVTTFSYGGQSGYTQTYAPFEVDSDTTVRAGSFGAPPPKLIASYEVP